MTTASRSFLQAVSSLPHLADAIYDHFPELAGMLPARCLSRLRSSAHRWCSATWLSVSKSTDRPGRGYADVDAYPADPAAAEAEAFGYWKDNGKPFEAAAFAALVARHVAEIAEDGLKGQRQ